MSQPKRGAVKRWSGIDIAEGWNLTGSKRYALVSVPYRFRNMRVRVTITRIKRAATHKGGKRV